MNLIPYGIWGRDSPWQNVEAWLLKFSPFMTCETILIQRNALGGEKCRQFKSLCMCMEQWIQAIIGWPLLTCTEAYRKLMKNLKVLNKQVKTHCQMASLVASKEACFLISGKTETAWTPNSELNHLDALNVIKAKDRQLVGKLEILIQGTETTVQTSSKILLLRLLGTRESAKVPHSPYQKLALPLSHFSECFWAKQHKAPQKRISPPLRAAVPTTSSKPQHKTHGNVLGLIYTLKQQQEFVSLYWQEIGVHWGLDFEGPWSRELGETG